MRSIFIWIQANTLDPMIQSNTETALRVCSNSTIVKRLDSIDAIFCTTRVKVPPSGTVRFCCNRLLWGGHCLEGLRFSKLSKVFSMALLCLALVAIRVASADTPSRPAINACEPDKDGHPLLRRFSRFALIDTPDIHYKSGSISIFEAGETVNRLPILDLRLIDISMQTLIGHFSKLITDVVERGRQKDQGVYKFRAVFRDIASTNTSGTYASEKISGAAVLRLTRNNSHWNFEFELELQDGEFYLEPIYLKFREFPLRLMAIGRWDENERRVVLKKLEYVQQDVVRLLSSGKAILTDCLHVEDFNIEALHFSLPKGYESYFLPFTAGTTFDKHSVTGNLSITADWNRGAGSAIRFELDDINFLDEHGRIELEGTSGVIDWPVAGDGAPSKLAWKRLVLLGLELGQGSIEGDVHDYRIEVEEDVRVAVPSGEIHIRDLNVTGPRSQAFRLSLNMALKSVDMPALVWLPSTGTLSAESLDVTYENDHLVIDGDMTAAVYDGHIKTDRVSIRSPYGLFPQVYVGFEGNLSLRALTSGVPQFGLMEGRVDIYGRDLYFEAGSLVAGEFGIRSLEPDAEPHWISTQALENLAFLFGKGSGLNHWMFSVFPMWRYDGIGMDLNLKNGVLAQKGIKNQGEYFLITDSELPPTVRLAIDSSNVDYESVVRSISLKMTSWLTGIKVDTQAVLNLTANIGDRFGEELRAGLCSGLLGLTRDGGVAVKDESPRSSRTTSKLLDLVSSHNQDVNDLYVEIALANGQPNWEQEIRSAFAKVWKDLAGPGWWIETDRGWERSKGNIDSDPCASKPKAQHIPAQMGKGGRHG